MSTIPSDKPSRFRPGAVLGPEALSPAELGKVRALLALSGQKGVLVGIQAGHAAWDMRPLLLDKGVTSIIRFSNPALEQNPAAAGKAGYFLNRLKSVAQRVGVTGCGQAENHFWIKRPYHKDVFITQPGWAHFTSEAARAAVIRKLVGILNDLKPHGIIHGHICSSNLTMPGDPLAGLEPLFLDFGALFIDPGLPLFWTQDPGRFGVEVAPEILEGAEPGEATDIYGLGLILKVMHNEQPFQAAGGADCSGFISRMLSAQPSARPGLIEVVRTFVPRGLLPEELSREPRSEPGKGVRSGRIIAPPPEKPVVRESPSGAAEPKSEEPKASPSSPPQQEDQVNATLEKVNTAAILFHDSNPPVPDTRDNSSGDSNPRLIRMLLVLAVLVAVFFMFNHKFERTELPAERPEADYIADWTSNQPSRMEKVARASLQRPDSRARGIILKSAFSGVEQTGLRSGLIRIAFDPRWEKSLKESDRRLVLALSLQELLPSLPPDLPPLPDAHPAVLMAIAGGVALERAPAVLQEVPLDRLAQLPAPVGAGFAQLVGQGLKTLSEKPALALAQIISGNVSEEVVGAYFDVAEGQENQQVGRLVALAPFFTQTAGLDRQTYAVLQKGGSVLRRALAWFEGEEIVKWKDIPRGQILGIITGSTSGRDLQLEHYIDLLKFPLPAVRSMAQRRLVETFVPEVMFSTISFLATPQNRLNRFQDISLVFALKGREGTGESALISAWFKSRPDPQSVLGLLLTRRSVEKEDVFNLEAARYLAAEDFEISVAQLKELAGHPETLARALAISRLDGSKPEEAAILKDMAVVEPNERIRNQIKEKIAGR